VPKKPTRANVTVRNLIVISDTHAGCRLSVIHPSGIQLDGGGRYLPSAFQEKLWALWTEFWESWVPQVTKGEPFDLVHNGDALEGCHHRATTQISHNLEDQQRIAEAVLAPAVAKCKRSGGTYYHIRGTEAHVGQSGEYEERLARTLGAKPTADGQYARWDLWKRVGSSKGPLVHLLHHVGTTGSAAHEASAVNAELTAEYVEAARWGRQPPDFIVRSHRHRSIAVDLNSARGYAAAIVTPAWQGRTPFTWKIPGARISEPQVGGILIREGDEEFFYRRWVRTFDRSPEE
jgi:hypothetical protein